MSKGLFSKLIELAKDIDAGISISKDSSLIDKVFEQEYKILRKREIKRAVKTFFILLSIGFCFSIIIKSFIAQFFVGGSHLLVVWSVTIFFSGPAAIYVIYRFHSNLRPGKSVLWLRRFQKDDKQLFKIYPLLNELIRNVAVGITIQDGSFPKSEREITERFTFFMYSVFGLFMCSMIVYISLDVANSSHLPIIGGIFILVIILPLPIFNKLYGSYNLDANNYSSQISKILNEIRSGKGPVYRGILVLRCEENYWRDTIKHALSKVDAAIIDVTEINDNIFWELEQAIHYLTPESIILIYRNDSGKETSIPESILQDITPIISSEKLSLVKQFVYPSKDRLIDVQYTFWAWKLRPLMIEAVYHREIDEMLK
jgi:hypothetical protein